MVGKCSISLLACCRTKPPSHSDSPYVEGPYQYVIESIAMKKVPLDYFNTEKAKPKAIISKNSECLPETFYPLTSIPVRSSHSSSSPSFLSRALQTPMEEKPIIKMLSVSTQTSEDSITWKTNFKPCQCRTTDNKCSITYARCEDSNNAESQPESLCSMEHPSFITPEDREKLLVAEVLNQRSSSNMFENAAVSRNKKGSLQRSLKNPIKITRQSTRSDNTGATGSVSNTNSVQLYSKHYVENPFLTTKEVNYNNVQEAIKILNYLKRPHILGLSTNKNQNNIWKLENVDENYEKEKHVELQKHDADTLPKEKEANCKASKKLFGKHKSKEKYVTNRGKDCQSSSNINVHLQDVIVKQTEQNSNHRFKNALPKPPDITEIRQLKGQNLKWKIIIRHQDDKRNIKNKPDDEFDRSDSESNPDR